MTFEEWFNEKENFSFRCDRFYCDLRMYKFNDKIDEKIILDWIKAAYNTGYDHTMSNLIDDGK